MCPPTSACYKESQPPTAVRLRASMTPSRRPSFLCLPVQVAILVLSCLSLAAAAYHSAGLMLLPDILSPVSPSLDIVFLSTHAALCVCMMYFATRRRKGWYQVCSATKLVHYLAVVFVFFIAVVAEAVVQGKGKEVLSQALVVGEISVLVADGIISGMLCYCGTVMIGKRKREGGVGVVV